MTASTLLVDTGQYQFIYGDTGEYGFPATLKISRRSLSIIGSYVEAGILVIPRVASHLYFIPGAYSWRVVQDSKRLLENSSRRLWENLSYDQLEIGTNLAGVHVSLAYAHFLVPLAGSYLESGAGSVLVHGYNTGVSKGSSVESGAGAIYSYHRFVSGFNGSYQWAGLSSTFVPFHGAIANSTIATVGTYSESGRLLGTRAFRHLLANAGFYFEGIESRFLLENSSRRILENRSSRILEGFGLLSNLVHKVTVSGVRGSYADTGNQALLTVSQHGNIVFIPGSGNYAESRNAAGLVRSRFATGAKGLYNILTNEVFQLTFSSGAYSSSGALFSRVLLRNLVVLHGTYTEREESHRLLQNLSRRLLENRSNRILEQTGACAQVFGHQLLSDLGHYPNVSYFASGSYLETGLGATAGKHFNTAFAGGLYSSVGKLVILGAFRHTFASSGIYAEFTESYLLLQSNSRRLLENLGYRRLEYPILRPGLIHGYILSGSYGFHGYGGFLASPIHSYPLNVVGSSYFESGDLGYNQVIHHLVALAGTYSEAGLSAPLKSTRYSYVAKGIYSGFGSVVTAVHASLLAGAEGAYGGLGKPATAIHVRSQAIQAGLHAESGVVALFSHQIRQAVTLGSYSGVGKPATPIRTTPSTNVLLGLTGIYSEVPTAAFLKLSAHLIASVRLYSCFGNSAFSVHLRNLFSLNGSHSETGLALTQIFSRRLATLASLYGETGAGLSLAFKHFLVGSPGAYSEFGKSSVLKPTYHLLTSAGSYSESAAVASVASIRHLSVIAGGYSELGSSVSELGIHRLMASTGSYSESSLGIGFVYSHLPVMSSGIYQSHGFAASLSCGHPVSATHGSYSLTGKFAFLTYSSINQGQIHNLSVNTGSYFEAPAAVVLRSLRHLPSGVGTYYSLGRISIPIYGYNSISFVGSYFSVGKSEFSEYIHVLGSALTGYRETGFGLTESLQRQYLVSAANSLDLHPSSIGGFDLSTSSLDSIAIVSLASGVVIHPPPETPTRAVKSQVRLTPRASSAITRREFSQLGRFRHGDKVILSVTLPGIPDLAPIATVFLDGPDQLIGAYPLPSIDSTNLNFALSLQMSSGFSFGTYLCSYQFTIGGIQGVMESAQFQVIPGGDAGGEIIFMYALDRPEATFVLTQLDSGRLCVGRNPNIGV